MKRLLYLLAFIPFVCQGQVLTDLPKYHNTNELWEKSYGNDVALKAATVLNDAELALSVDTAAAQRVDINLNDVDIDSLKGGEALKVSEVTTAYVLFYNPVTNTTTYGDTTDLGAAGGGNVFKVDTPEDGQLGYWTGDGTIEGQADIYDTMLGDSGVVRGIFVVTDYGAVADEATDNTPFFQAAVDACESAGGGIVYIPGASTQYFLDSTVRISSSGVRIIGGGARNTVLRFTSQTGGYFGFHFEAGGNTLMYYSGLEGVYIYLYETDITAIKAVTTQLCEFDRVEIRNFSGAFDQTIGFSFTGKNVTGWSGGNVMTNCFTHDVSTGIRIDSISNNNRFMYNWIGGNSAKYTGGVGVKLHVEDGGQCDGNIFYGNDFEGWEKAIEINAPYAKFTDNRFETLDTAIHITLANAKASITGSQYAGSVVTDIVPFSAANYASVVLEEDRLILGQGSHGKPTITLGSSSAAEGAHFKFLNAAYSGSLSPLKLSHYGESSVEDALGQTKAINRGVISSDYDLSIGTANADSLTFYTNSGLRLFITSAGAAGFTDDLDVGGDLTVTGSFPSDFAITDYQPPLLEYWEKTKELNHLPAFEGKNRGNVMTYINGLEEAAERNLRYIVDLEFRLKELEQLLKE